MSVHEITKEDINNIIAKNTKKLQSLYIDVFNAKHEQDIKSISNQINYIRNNEEIFDLVCRTKDADK